jgi:MYXO-CTERM domain-containing protein
MTLQNSAIRLLRILGPVFLNLTLVTSSLAAPITLTVGGAQPANPGPPVGGVAIVDNGPMDSNPALGTIVFNSAAAGGAGFVVAQGYLVSGRVTTGGGGALAGLANIVNIVSLTDLDVMRPAGAAGGQLEISFSESFAAPAAPVDAADGYEGQFLNAGGTIATGFIALRGSVNGMRIGGVDVDVVVDVASPRNVKQSDLIRGVAGGPPWLLRGELSVLLGPGDRLLLPNSAEVGIALFGLGALGVLSGRRRRRTIWRHRDVAGRQPFAFSKRRQNANAQ